MQSIWIEKQKQIMNGSVENLSCLLVIISINLIIADFYWYILFRIYWKRARKNEEKYKIGVGRITLLSTNKRCSWRSDDTQRNWL